MKNIESDKVITISTTKLDGASKQSSGYIGDKWSEKRIHRDPHAILVSHVYGPIDSFKQGNFHIVDDKQIMHDSKKPFEDIYERKPGTCIPLLKEDILTDDYTITVNTSPSPKGTPLSVPIVFFNNTEIAHGASQLEILNLTKFKRVFNRITLTLHRSAQALFPFHTPERHKSSQLEIFTPPLIK